MKQKETQGKGVTYALLLLLFLPSMYLYRFIYDLYHDYAIWGTPYYRRYNSDLPHDYIGGGTMDTYYNLIIFIVSFVLISFLFIKYANPKPGFQVKRFIFSLFLIIIFSTIFFAVQYFINTSINPW